MQNVDLSEVLHEHTDYLLYAMRSTDDPWAPGRSIIHVEKSSGQLTVLTHSGVMARRSARISYVFRRIAGLVVQDDYLWMIMYQSVPFATDAHDNRPDLRTIKQYLPTNWGSHLYQLEVFSLTSGEKLDEYWFDMDTASDNFDSLREAVRDELEAGPIQLRQDGIRCFGTSLVILNNRVISEGHPE